MASKIVIAAAAAAAIVGAGGTALATTGSDTPSPAPSGSSSSSHHGTGKHDGKGKHGKHGLLRHTEHGVFVTKGKKGTVTHDLIRGTVSSVSASSIAVKAADGTSMTFSVTKDTKVRQRTVKSGSDQHAGKPASSSISKVSKGDRVFVAGTGASTKTARVVVDVKK